MISVTLRFGATKSVTIKVATPVSVKELIADPSTRAYLGYPENVSAVIDGVTVGLDHIVADGDEVLLEKQAAAKA